MWRLAMPSGAWAAAHFCMFIVRPAEQDNQKYRQRMKKVISIFTVLMITLTVRAQEVKAREPEFINSYCILTSDSTYAELPKETGQIKKHRNKVSKWSRIAESASLLGGAAGFLGMATAGSVNGVLTGARVVGAAGSVGTAASAVNGLAGSSGMDIVFSGGKSAYQVDGVQEIRLLIKGESNDTDPKDCYRIVRFNASKKERRIQWMEFEPALIGSPETKKAGYLQFTGHKYGEQSYLITIPASELEKGEYGIFFMSIITATSIPVGTFSVR